MVVYHGKNSVLPFSQYRVVNISICATLFLTYSGYLALC